MSKELTINNVNELQTFANMVAGAYDLGSPKEIAARISIGMALGMTPGEAISTGLHIIKGKPVASAGWMSQRIKAHARYDYQVIQNDDKVCIIKFYEKSKRTGEWQEYEYRFSIDDAKKAGLLDVWSGGDKKGQPVQPNWFKYPRAMLFSRCISAGARAFIPDAISGTYTADELGEHEEINITPQETPYSDLQTANAVSDGAERLTKAGIDADKFIKPTAADDRKSFISQAQELMDAFDADGLVSLLLRMEKNKLFPDVQKRIKERLAEPVQHKADPFTISAPFELLEWLNEFAERFDALDLDPETQNEKGRLLCAEFPGVADNEIFLQSPDHFKKASGMLPAVPDAEKQDELFQEEL